jgi:membrane protein DedA with SNARE-associated domain
MTELLLKFASDHTVLIFLLGSFFSGEEVVLAFAFLAGQGFWSGELLYFCVCAGTLCSDIAWFWIGRYSHRKDNFIKRFIDKHKVKIPFQKELSCHPFLLLLVTKFIYGVRIFTIFYVAVEGLSFRKFFIYIIPCIAIIQVLVIGSGWLAGKGSSLFLDIYKDTTMTLAILLGIGIITYTLKRKITKRLLKN